MWDIILQKKKFCFFQLHFFVYFSYLQGNKCVHQRIFKENKFNIAFIYSFLIYWLSRKFYTFYPEGHSKIFIIIIM